MDQIGLRAFYGCTSLTGITIPEKVTRIHEGCFFGCSSLLLVFLPDGISSIDGLAFKKCSSIQGIPLPAKLRNIGSQAFQFCTSLAKITIPETVTWIDNWAFASCTNLTKATFEGEAPTTFGSSVFSGVSPAFSIYYHQGYAGWTTPTWNGYLTTMIMADTSPSITCPTLFADRAGGAVYYFFGNCNWNGTHELPMEKRWCDHFRSNEFELHDCICSESDAGSYHCAVSNHLGSTATSQATLTVTAADTSPRITSDPSSQTAQVGQSVTFSVTASGTDPLSYQWKKEGNNIAERRAQVIRLAL